MCYKTGQLYLLTTGHELTKGAHYEKARQVTKAGWDKQHLPHFTSFLTLSRGLC